MAIPIRVEGQRAIVDANPSAEPVQFLDHWGTHGYIATLGTLEGKYLLRKVIYDLSRVPFRRVQEIATRIENGEFACPVCNRMGELRASTTKPPEPPVPPPGVPAVDGPVQELICADEDVQRRAALNHIISDLDTVLLMYALRTGGARGRALR